MKTYFHFKKSVFSFTLYIKVRFTMNFFFALQVLYIYIVLGLQNLLRVRFHAAGVPDSDNSDGLRDNSLHVFPAERGRLSLAMDFVFGSCFNRRIRVYLRVLLLLLQDEVSTFKISRVI